MKRINGIYLIKETLSENTERFFAGTSFIQLFPGISMCNKDGALSWCHNFIVAVTPKTIDHRRPETIMFFANKDGTMHFKKWKSWGSSDDHMEDDYKHSEVDKSRLKGYMDVSECIKRYISPDGYRYSPVNSKAEFDKKRLDIVQSYPELAVEIEEDCENIHERIFLS